jgi:hypothetical protein
MGRLAAQISTKVLNEAFGSSATILVPIEYQRYAPQLVLNEY